MTIKRKCAVPGLVDISSDTDSDSDLNIGKCIVNSDAILIEDSSLSDSDIDIISVECVGTRKSANEVWRNIIECDLLDERVKCIGLEAVIVHRDCESYELPPRKCKRMKYSNNRRKQQSRVSHQSRRMISKRVRFKEVHQRRQRSRSRSRHRLEDNIINLSSSADEIEIIEFQPSKSPNCTLKSEKNPIIIQTSENDTSSSSSSDDDQEDNKSRLDSWTKLINHLHRNQFQIEFEDGRKNAALRIARELNETKVDLIDRCLIYLGVEKCSIFLEATKKIEATGGMPTKDGSRRRTPGGVFLTMIKSDRTIEYVVKQQIFLDSDNQDENNGSLWWKSLETFQYKRSAQFRGVSNYARKKEFKSYTLLDLDYFQSIRDFRYRYIPIMSNFPLHEIRRYISNIVVDDSDSDTCMITEVSQATSVTASTKMSGTNSRSHALDN